MDWSSEEVLRSLVERILTAECPWDELAKFFDECRQQNAVQGGDDLMLAGMIAYFVGRIELPVKKVTKK